MDGGDVLQALWDAAMPLRDARGEGGQEACGLVQAAFFVHVAERVVCEPCGNKVTHTRDFYEQAICASATSIRRCHQVCALIPLAIWRFLPYAIPPDCSQVWQREMWRVEMW